MSNRWTSRSSGRHGLIVKSSPALTIDLKSLPLATRPAANGNITLPLPRVSRDTPLARTKSREFFMHITNRRHDNGEIYTQAP
jgi:hypothetical protein